MWQTTVSETTQQVRLLWTNCIGLHMVHFTQKIWVSCLHESGLLTQEWMKYSIKSSFKQFPRIICDVSMKIKILRGSLSVVVFSFNSILYDVSTTTDGYVNCMYVDANLFEGNWMRVITNCSLRIETQVCSAIITERVRRGEIYSCVRTKQWQGANIVP